MQWTMELVRKKLGGKLIGTPFMREMVCKTILFLPAAIINDITTKVWFISSQEDAWALTFRGEELKERHLIFLSDVLLKENSQQISYTILHEIGHVVLKHRNAIGREQTQTEIDSQEVAADRFAQHYLRNLLENK